MGKGLTWPSFKELCTKIKWKFPTSWWMGLKHWVLPTATKTAKCNSKTVCVFSLCLWMQLVKRLNYKRLKDFSRTRCRPGILFFTRASFHRKTNLILTTWRKTDETNFRNGTPKKKKIWTTRIGVWLAERTRFLLRNWCQSLARQLSAVFRTVSRTLWIQSSERRCDNCDSL